MGLDSDFTSKVSLEIAVVFEVFNHSAGCVSDLEIRARWIIEHDKLCSAIILRIGLNNNPGREH
jgi:hypothetical protein